MLMVLLRGSECEGIRALALLRARTMRVRETGLTMIELVMALAVAGILTVVAVSDVAITGIDTGTRARVAGSVAVSCICYKSRSVDGTENRLLFGWRANS